MFCLLRLVGGSFLDQNPVIYVLLNGRSIKWWSPKRVFRLDSNETRSIQINAPSPQSLHRYWLLLNSKVLVYHYASTRCCQEIRKKEHSQRCSICLLYMKTPFYLTALEENAQKPFAHQLKNKISAHLEFQYFGSARLQSKRSVSS